MRLCAWSILDLDSHSPKEYCRRNFYFHFFAITIFTIIVQSIQRWVDRSGKAYLEHAFTKQLERAVGELDINSMRQQGLNPSNVVHLRLKHLQNLSAMTGGWLEFYSYTSAISIQPEINIHQVEVDFPKVLSIVFGAEYPDVALMPAQSLRRDMFLNHTIVTEAYKYLEVRQCEGTNSNPRFQKCTVFSINL